MRLKLDGTVKEIDLLVFDCDGVLLETMAAKIEAFRQWVPAGHAQYSEAFMERVMHGFGKSRMHHIRVFYEEIVGEVLSEAVLESEIARFTSICEPLCASADWRVGSAEFVEACQAEGIPRYVLSGTPQKPLEDMLESAGGTAMFTSIIGSPPAKPESMEGILAETGISAERTLFIGDANADHEAALHVGAHFVYFPSEALPPKQPVNTTVDDLRELLV
jgi:beta-phosphoglucomutase-like phosphatase (HAD superfamily)